LHSKDAGEGAKSQICGRAKRMASGGSTDGLAVFERAEEEVEGVICLRYVNQSKTFRPRIRSNSLTFAVATLAPMVKA
jgi:hypothetical protein